MIFTRALKGLQKDVKKPILERVQKSGQLQLSKRIKKIEVNQDESFKVFLRNLPENCDEQEIRNLSKVDE